MKGKKRYQDMTTAELARATGDYDRPGTIERTRPMTPAERARDQKGRRAGGRPRIGRGAKRINITVERGLLAAADRLAQQTGMKRSELISLALQSTLSQRKAS